MVSKRKMSTNDKDNNNTDDTSASSSVPSKLCAQCTGEPPPTPSASSHNPFIPYPSTNIHRLIEPGPVLVATGSLAAGTHNVMTVGFHMPLQHAEPPLLAIALGPWDASFVMLRGQRECVLAVPAVEMAKTVVDVGNCSANDEDDGGEAERSGGDDGGTRRGGGRGGEIGRLNKWTRFDLEALSAAAVQAPLVGGPHVIANIESVVEDTRMVSRYSLWVLRPVRAWLNPNKKPGEQGGGQMFHHLGDGTFVVDGDELDLRERMVKWEELQN